MTASFHRSLRLFILRWHRRVGVVLCFAIVWIASTGIVLNHMYEWNVAEKLIHNTWVKQQYALTEPVYYQVGQNLAVVQAASGELLVNEQPIAMCDSPLQGAEAIPNILVVACSNELLLLSAGGELIETVTASQGLPIPVRGLSVEQGRLFVHSNEWYAFNDNDFSFVATPRPRTQGNRPQLIPEAIQNSLKRQLEAKPVSWERVLIDMHTGAFWGKGNHIISDIAAVLMMLIAIGGVWVWLTKPGRFR